MNIFHTLAERALTGRYQGNKSLCSIGVDIVETDPAAFAHWRESVYGNFTFFYYACDEDEQCLFLLFVGESYEPY